MIHYTHVCGEPTTCLDVINLDGFAFLTEAPRTYVCSVCDAGMVTEPNTPLPLEIPCLGCTPTNGVFPRLGRPKPWNAILMADMLTIPGTDIFRIGEGPAFTRATMRYTSVGMALLFPINDENRVEIPGRYVRFGTVWPFPPQLRTANGIGTLRPQPVQLEPGQIRCGCNNCGR